MGLQNGSSLVVSSSILRGIFFWATNKKCGIIEGHYIFSSPTKNWRGTWICITNIINYQLCWDDSAEWMSSMVFEGTKVINTVRAFLAVLREGGQSFNDFWTWKLNLILIPFWKHFHQRGTRSMWTVLGPLLHGTQVYECGEHLVKHCDRFVQSQHPEHGERLHAAAYTNSRMLAGRLLHYFSPSEGNNTEDAWCGWHNDAWRWMGVFFFGEISAYPR